MTEFEQHARELLDKAAKQFRFYEDQHRNKTVPWNTMLTTTLDPDERARLTDDIEATLQKATVNGALAHEIEMFLNTGERL
jgi:hypothetical protein